MSKVKMRCVVCGKWFQSANAKESTCPDCVQKARREKMAAKNAPSTAQKTASAGVQSSANHVRNIPPPPKAKPTQSGTSHWLDTIEDVKVARPEQPVRPKTAAPPVSPENRGAPEAKTGRGSTESRSENTERAPIGQRPSTPAYPGQRPRQPSEAEPGRGPRLERPNRWSKEGAKEGGKPRGKAKTPHPPAPPRPKKEKTPPPQPFVPTEEQVAQVEARYLELAQPSEFDGIRTQISKELSIPKKAVKKIITNLRERQRIPSWWEIQSYKGAPEELERIKEVYIPMLPIPDVGVHKQIAEQLALKATDVYQAIKSIRLEMNLPQYNDPSKHEGELPSQKETDAEKPTANGTVSDDTSTTAVEAAITDEAAPVAFSTEVSHDATKE
jgi:hypothetical protein